MSCRPPDLRRRRVPGFLGGSRRSPRPADRSALCSLAPRRSTTEIAAEAPWSRLVDVLERLEAVRYTAEGETIVQTSRIGPELAAILKKLDISTPKPILAVG
jgi:hypothetical protein